MHHSHFIVLKWQVVECASLSFPVLLCDALWHFFISHNRSALKMLQISVLFTRNCQIPVMRVDIPEGHGECYFLFCCWTFLRYNARVLKDTAAIIELKIHKTDDGSNLNSSQQGYLTGNNPFILTLNTVGYLPD